MSPIYSQIFGIIGLCFFTINEMIKKQRKMIVYDLAFHNNSNFQM